MNLFRKRWMLLLSAALLAIHVDRSTSFQVQLSSSSRLFPTHHHRQRRILPLLHEREPSSGSSGSSSSSGGESKGASSSPSSATTKIVSGRKEKPTKSLLSRIDEAGQALKPAAIRASAKQSLENRRARKFLLLVQTVFLYSLFIVYRAYRGFFVILPAVFTDVYRKLDAAGESPFESPFQSSSRQTDVEDDIDHETGRMRWRTRIVVSCVAGIITASYLLEGAIRVGVKLIRSLVKTKDVPTSFAAAVDEQESNESKMMLMTQSSINGLPGGSSKNSSSSSGDTENYNGDGNPPYHAPPSSELLP